MKREGWFWKIIAPTGAIIPYSHEYDAGYGINQHDACIKLRIGQKCFDGIGIKPVLWEAGHRNRAAIPNIKKEASICAAVVVKIGRKPEKK